MWLFTRYGFYSVACAGEPGGPDNDTLMIRARRKAHLERLQARFPSIADAEILVWPKRDYLYRIIVPKSIWVELVAELAREQTWSNFKSEVERFQAGAGRAYSSALHRIWSTMFQLQQSER